MAKYIANPVEVDAFKILDIRYPEIKYPEVSNGEIILTLEDGRQVNATAYQTARFSPTKGDYYVVQADGYVYLNPAAVFERKYSPKVELGPAVQKAFL